MRPLRHSINVTLDGCCDHRAMFTDEDMHRHAADNLAQADALLSPRSPLFLQGRQRALRLLHPLFARMTKASFTTEVFMR